MDTKSTPKVSIVVPIHDMKNGEFFLWRLVNSLTAQTFKDWELIITKEGKMAKNSNEAIRRARGKLIKVLYLDDAFSDEYCLEEIVSNFKDEDEWLITGANTNPNPYYTDDIETGNNHLGSPSALTFRNHFEDNLLFDETLSWLLDCCLYKRLYEKFGLPKLIPGARINVGQGDHQMTNILTAEEKLAEHNYLNNKYAK